MSKDETSETIVKPGPNETWKGETEVSLWCRYHGTLVAIRWDRYVEIYFSTLCICFGINSFLYLYIRISEINIVYIYISVLSFLCCPVVLHCSCRRQQIECDLDWGLDKFQYYVFHCFFCWLLSVLLPHWRTFRDAVILNDVKDSGTPSHRLAVDRNISSNSPGLFDRWRALSSWWNHQWSGSQMPFTMQNCLDRVVCSNHHFFPYSLS